jgi:hypothetical protein
MEEGIRRQGTPRHILLSLLLPGAPGWQSHSAFWPKDMYVRSVLLKCPWVCVYAKPRTTFASKWAPCRPLWPYLASGPENASNEPPEAYSGHISRQAAKIAPGASWCLLAPPGAPCCFLVAPAASWCLLVPPGASWCLLVPPGAFWVPPGGS